jgi:SAM-dependent methyltransferase
MNTPAEYFDSLFATSEDPWSFRQRWYEKRKRDLSLAALLHQRYERIFEPGCANGELSLALAERSDHFLGMDLCERAVDLARGRLSSHSHARIEQGAVPADWPAGQFDLIVLSEVGYYLAPAQWQEVIRQAERSLRPTGSILACHWLHAIDGCPMEGAQVHRMLSEHLTLPRQVRHQERDFLLELWSADTAALNLEEQIL